MSVRFHRAQCHAVLPLVILCVLLGLCGQAVPDTSNQGERQKAAQLFSEGRRLEALPLLEKVVKANPKDDEMLVDVAASLVEEAGTLTDQKAAGKERLRARDLLEEARDLGNRSSLALNLLQLLQQLPESGDIQFSDDPQVERALRAGEAAFSRRDFNEALRNYAKALELAPEDYSAILFSGNTYDRKNQSAKAAEWYERAIQLEPNVETAYRYYADMLAREGDMAKARLMLIRAAVAEPYNRIVWRELHAWANLNHSEIHLVYVGIPPAREDAQRPDPQLAVGHHADLSAAWDAYRSVRDRWRTAGEFKKHFSDEKEYRHSLTEESEALTAEARMLEKLQADNNVSEQVGSNTALVLLLKLYHAGLIEPYVLFSLGDAGIARDYAAYRIHNRDRLERYMEKFVVPPAP